MIEVLYTSPKRFRFSIKQLLSYFRGSEFEVREAGGKSMACGYMSFNSGKYWIKLDRKIIRVSESNSNGVRKVFIGKNECLRLMKDEISYRLISDSKGIICDLPISNIHSSMFKIFSVNLDSKNTYNSILAASVFADEMNKGM